MLMPPAATPAGSYSVHSAKNGPLIEYIPRSPRDAPLLGLGGGFGGSSIQVHDHFTSE